MVILYHMQPLNSQAFCSNETLENVIGVNLIRSCKSFQFPLYLDPNLVSNLFLSSISSAEDY